MELKQEIKSSLRQVIAKEQGKVYCTGELRVVDLATDCLKAIEELEAKAQELDRREKGVALVNVSNDPTKEHIVCGHCGDLAKTNYCGSCGTKLIWEATPW